MVAPLVAAGAAAAESTLLRSAVTWLWRHKLLAAMGIGAAADKITGGESTKKAQKVIEETAKDGFNYAAEKLNPFDFDIDFDMGKMLHESFEFMKKNFNDNTAAFLGAGAGLLGAFYANGGSLWRATVGIALGAAVYFGYKHFFQNDFNKSANPPGLAMQLESKPEETLTAKKDNTPAASTAPTTGQPLTKEARDGLSGIFERKDVASAANTKKTKPEEEQPEITIMTDQPTNDLG